MTGVLDVLGSLGAEKLRDGSWKIELDRLRLHSLFGGSLTGAAAVFVSGESVSFQSPPELVACGKMWVAAVVDVDGFREAVLDAHTQLCDRVTLGIASLRRLGFKAKITAPDPRARARLQIDRHDVIVALDESGDLVVEEVAGRSVPPDQRRALIAPDQASEVEAQRRVAALVHAFWARQGARGSKAGSAVLSQEDLAELQAVLIEEPTNANVPPPGRGKSSRAFSIGEGTLQVAVLSSQPLPITAREDDVGTVDVRVPGARTPKSSLIDAFDDDIFNKVDRDSATATRPRAAGAPSEEVDLLAALDDDEPVQTPRAGISGRLSLADFPAFDGISASTMIGATAVNPPLNVLPQLPPEAAAMHRSELLDDDADGFDDGEGAVRRSATRHYPDDLGDDSLADADAEAKTRAGIDKALLEKLKRASDLARTAELVVTPAGGTPTTSPVAIGTPPSVEPDRLDDPPPAPDQILHARDGLSEADIAEIAALSFRADELMAELAAVHERIAALQAERAPTHSPTRPASIPVGLPIVSRAHEAGEPYAENSVPSGRGGNYLAAGTAKNSSAAGTATNSSAAGTAKNSSAAGTATNSPAAGTAKNYPAAAAKNFHRSDDFSARDQSNESATGKRPPSVRTSLPSLASIDVQEVEASAPPIQDGVLLAELQGALKEMGVDLGETDETEMAKPRPPSEREDDVFGSSGDGEGRDLAQDATRIRPTRPSAIALVVEDAKARDRLRRHLEPRFGELFEADNALMVSQLKEIARVDAIVFVRPSSSEPHRQDFVKLNSLPHRPRVLVISGDIVFDGVAGVDLRLPLGEKASEVAQQIVLGLGRLGVLAQVL